MTPSFFDPLRLEDNGDETFTLLEQFRYLYCGTLITVPAGFVTDFASIPHPFWNILAPYGRHGKAAVIHDYLYSTHGMSGVFVRAECDEVFRFAMAALGVSTWRRVIMFEAVRACGWHAWNRKQALTPLVECGVEESPRRSS